MRTLPRRPAPSPGTGPAVPAMPATAPTARDGAPAPAAPAAAAVIERPPLETPLAQALFHVWSGSPATVVASPPGAGKTRLVVHVADQLARRADLRIAVAAQTRAQAVDVANRAAKLAPVTLLGKAKSLRPRGLAAEVRYAAGHAQLPRTAGIVTATTARWLVTPPPVFRADVLVVDEAWQMTYAALNALGALSDQVLLVGDPGQIAPVVRARTDRWLNLPAGPHLPAPAALAAAYPDHVVQLRLPSTYRLGPATTALIQPLYPDLPFTSARPHRELLVDGRPEPELAALPLAPQHRDDPDLALAAAERVRYLLAHAHLDTADATPRPLAPQDLAVLAPHVSQVALVAALLADLPDVLVGTHNQTQGLERDAVVVIHPLAGYRDTPVFAVDPGRLCVALSRHRTHATVITDNASPQRLRRALAADPENATLRVQQAILDTLMSAS